MPFTHFEITGNKILLRPIRLDDAESRLHLLQDDAVLTYLATSGYISLAEMKERMERAVAEWKTGQSYMCAIEWINEPGFIGNISIRFRTHPLQADIGYWVGQRYWNKGYVTEAIRLTCHVCFTHLNSNKVYATVFVGNDASRRVLEKNGFSLDGTIKRYFYKDGTWKDGWFFSLLKEEWEQRIGYFLPSGQDIAVGE